MESHRENYCNKRELRIKLARFFKKKKSRVAAWRRHPVNPTVADMRRINEMIYFWKWNRISLAPGRANEWRAERAHCLHFESLGYWHHPNILEAKSRSSWSWSNYLSSATDFFPFLEQLPWDRLCAVWQRPSVPLERSTCCTLFRFYWSYTGQRLKVKWTKCWQLDVEMIQNYWN